MNNPSQNELLSAYLDGELTADEQAEVERLLADDPAARQLLDELRALGAALQALPQEKLGEDLTGAVLRAAERQMLLGGGPGDAPTAVPRGRSVFRRWLNARGLVWAAVAAAVAVMIVVVEQRQRQLPMANKGADDKLALAEAKPAGHVGRVEKEKDEALPPRSQAVRDSVVESAKSGAAPAARKAEPSYESLAAKSAERPSPPAAAPAEAFFAAPRIEKAKGKWVEQAEAKAPAGKEVLVVHCDIAPEAAAKGDFDKLLAANGIAWRRHRARRNLDDGSRAGAGGGRQPIVAKKADKTPPLDSGEVDLIYVEATPDQVKATLAALAARPKSFFNVSVNPAQGASPSEDAHRYAHRDPDVAKAAPPAAGRGLRKKAVADKSENNVAHADSVPRTGQGALGAAPPSNMPGEAQRIPLPNSSDGEESDLKFGADAEGGDADRLQRKSQPRKERQTAESSAQSVPRQRVLFVLRVAGGDPPAAAAAARITEAERAKSDRAEERKAAAPSAPPAKQK